MTLDTFRKGEEHRKISLKWRRFLKDGYNTFNLNYKLVNSLRTPSTPQPCCPSWPDSLDGLIEIDGSCDLVSRGVSRANKPANVYNVGGLEGEKGRWQAGNQEGRQAADGGGVGVGSRLSLALTAVSVDIIARSGYLCYWQPYEYKFNK